MLIEKPIRIEFYTDHEHHCDCMVIVADLHTLAEITDEARENIDGRPALAYMPEQGKIEIIMRQA